jgi:transcriptional regulator with XRE-family HTH domain
LRELLSTNIKNKRETLGISQEKLAEALGVSAFQLLVPADEAALRDESALISVLLRNLQQNIQDDINTRFSRLKKDFN